MREILFRGKRVDNGEWVIGYYVQKQDPLLVGVAYHCILTQEKDSCGCLMSTVSWYKVIPESIGQYTGLTDKNGKKIFEGDIVTMPAYLGGRHKAVVYFKNGKFAVDGSHYYFKDIAPKNMEVIGNIHDNPKLLEAE